ncbi:MAG: hypothetical protein OHK0053_37590 [Microscillaceae bacterium]
MDLKEIAAIAGKPGLYKILKAMTHGVIVETLDSQKKRMSIGASHRVSVLKEVSIYTTDQEGSAPLAQVLKNIRALYPEMIPLDKQSSGADYEEFMAQVLPDFDREKVYTSDMKKLVKWYNTLVEFSPETFDALDEPEVSQDEETKAPEAKSEDNSEVTGSPETPVLEETTTTPKASDEKPKAKARKKKSETSEEPASPPAENQNPEETPTKKKRSRSKKKSEEGEAS